MSHYLIGLVNRSMARFFTLGNKGDVHEIMRFPLY
jgi:hypothetical protein